ncbi:restriction endonuclease [Kitasatospora phosalacinea]|uniref:restriction endonuclease n=1 Tax=Kitasatospora phosalacinea TaxID=2065 RepID=UPI0035DC3EEE
MAAVTVDSTPTQQVHAAAYGALVEALAAICWYKKDLERFLRRRVTGYPELLVGLDFEGDYKRVTADEFVDRLMADEQRYRQLTVDLMVEIASMDSFPALKRHADREQLESQATEAVADLKRWVDQHQGLAEQREAAERETALYRDQTAKRLSFAAKLEELKARFLGLDAMTDRKAAGRQFEGFLNQLFQLFDLEPRLGYKLPYEQIDGSLTFDTDDYIVEAKWWKDAIEVHHLGSFTEKVRRKGKNALGLFIAVNGFTSGARERYREGTCFITLDGGDLFAVLDGRITLTELLRRKKRHANETGSCYLPAHQVIG